jgi:hypothetical protein
LAISVLNENDLSWVKDLASDGSLRLLIDSLLIDDREIKASKCEVHSKAFYSFESKMALMIKVASHSDGARILIHLGLVGVISSLECVELYPYLINQNQICFTVFKNVMQLMITLCETTLSQDSEELSRFLSARSSVVYYMLRMASSLKSSEEGRSVLILTTSLVCQLITFASDQVQGMFIGSINNFTNGTINESEVQILANVLIGCVQLSRSSTFSPLFAPSWDYREAFVSVGQPSLGALVAIIEASVGQVKQSNLFTVVIESCLYLLWHHLNLYLTMDVQPSEKANVQRLRSQASDFVTDQFFSKIQNQISGNTFVDALIRRMIRTVRIKSTSSMF